MVMVLTLAQCHARTRLQARHTLPLPSAADRPRPLLYH